MIQPHRSNPKQYCNLVIGKLDTDPLCPYLQKTNLFIHILFDIFNKLSLDIFVEWKYEKRTTERKGQEQISFRASDI